MVGKSLGCWLGEGVGANVGAPSIVIQSINYNIVNLHICLILKPVHLQPKNGVTVKHALSF